MKRFVCILLALALMTSLCACGSGSKTPKEEDVTITLPAEFGEGVTQEDLDQMVEEEGWNSATLNEDGSVTYVMTKEKYEQMVQDIKDTIDEALTELVESGEYPNIVAMEANEDYTQYTVSMNADEVGLMESFVAFALYMYSGMYSVVTGTEAGDVTVQFVNADTGEVIQESHSSELG